MIRTKSFPNLHVTSVLVFQARITCQIANALEFNYEVIPLLGLGCTNTTDRVLLWLPGVGRASPDSLQVTACSQRHRMHTGLPEPLTYPEVCTIFRSNPDEGIHCRAAKEDFLGLSQPPPGCRQRSATPNSSPAHE